MAAPREVKPDPAPADHDDDHGAASCVRAAELRRWSAQLMRPGIAGLFLYGTPGIGKSVLAAHIAGRISSEYPGTRVTTVTGTLTVEQLAAILVPDSPSLVVLDQFDANGIADDELAAVLDYLADEITGDDARATPARIIVTARQPLACGPRIMVRWVGPLTRWSADELACSLPRLGQLTEWQRQYAWQLTAGHPGCLRSLDARLADATFTELADGLAAVIEARTGVPASQVFPAELDPLDAAGIVSAAEVALAAAGTTTGRRRRHRRLLIMSAALATAAIAWAPFAARPFIARPADADDSANSAAALATGQPAAQRTAAAEIEQAETAHAGTAQAKTAQAKTAQAKTAQAETAQAETEAASWLAGNMTPGSLIGCDPAMCASLSRHGIARADLSQLHPGEDLTADDLIVSTPPARALMDSAIAAAAPELAASFGNGAGRVEIREVTPGGAAAYHSSLLAADMASRRNGGNLMLGNPSIKAAGASWMALAEGHVDSRILLALAEMAHSAPLTIVSFGAANPGAAPEVPVRSVLIDVANPAAAAAYLKVRDPATQALAVRIGHASLWVEFGVPSPLGLFQARS